MQPVVGYHNYHDLLQNPYLNILRVRMNLHIYMKSSKSTDLLISKIVENLLNEKNIKRKLIIHVHFQPLISLYG